MVFDEASVSDCQGQNFEHDFTSTYRAVGPNMHVDGAHGIRTARDD